MEAYRQSPFNIQRKVDAVELELLHIYRNTPFGREFLLQSLYFCSQMHLTMCIYTPKDKKFLMYFEYGAVQVDLDDRYMLNPETVDANLEHIIELMPVKARRLELDHYTASGLPDMPTDFGFMCCPRAMSERASKTILASISKGVRSIIRVAPFPVLIPAPVFKPWKSVAVLFGGSVNGLKALHLGLRMSRESGLPLDVFSQAVSGVGRLELEAVVEKNGLGRAMQEEVRRWTIFENGDLGENLMAVPHDALVLLGVYGHGLVRDIKDMVFGSTMELAQSTLPNNLLVVGPNHMRQHSWQSA